MSAHNSRTLTVLALAGLVLGEGIINDNTLVSRTSDGTTGSNSSAGAAASALTAEAKVYNTLFGYYILMILAAILVALATYQFLLYSVRYVRLLTCLNNDKQMYFRTPNLGFARVKEHLLYAPLFRQRHNEEMHLFCGLKFGVLPTRFQTLLLSGIIAMNVVFCTYGLEWSTAGTVEMLNHLRNRTGTLSVVNMIPLVILAGRNNPLIGLLNISYDSFNLTHRWFGRMVTAEAVVHTVAWAVKQVKTSQLLSITCLKPLLIDDYRWLEGS